MDNFFYPIRLVADWFVYGLLGIETGANLAEALNFFIYDFLKILLLLIVITHLMGTVRYYLPVEKFRKFLISKRLYGLDYFLAATFGALTPFCSCSSIPLFIGFLQAGIPSGVAFTFLATSPLINEVAIALFIGLFGWKITLYYILAGIAVGMAGGFILQKLKMDKYVINLKKEKQGCSCKKAPPSLRQKAAKISGEAFDIVKKISLYLFIGVGVGSFIHGYVPQAFFTNYLQVTGIWSVPVAVVLAVPLYSNASGVIPIAQSLIAKGVPLGTGLAFMMAVVGLSLPEAMILKKVLKWQLLAYFFLIVTVGIILIGYLFNFML